MADAWIEDKYPIKELWRLLCEPSLISGPWIPYEGHARVYNHLGQPIAQAFSQEEMATEEARLVSLGWKLSDPERQFPPDWFTWKEEDR